MSPADGFIMLCNLIKLSSKLCKLYSIFVSLNFGATLGIYIIKKQTDEAYYLVDRVYCVLVIKILFFLILETKNDGCKQLYSVYNRLYNAVF